MRADVRPGIRAARRPGRRRTSRRARRARPRGPPARRRGPARRSRVGERRTPRCTRPTRSDASTSSATPSPATSAPEGVAQPAHVLDGVDRHRHLGAQQVVGRDRPQRGLVDRGVGDEDVAHPGARPATPPPARHTPSRPAKPGTREHPVEQGAAAHRLRGDPDRQPAGPPHEVVGVGVEGVEVDGDERRRQPGRRSRPVVRAVTVPTLVRCWPGDPGASGHSSVTRRARGGTGPGSWPPSPSAPSSRRRPSARSTGVLLEPIEAEFGWSRAVTSGAVSLNLVLYGLTAPFAAAFMERFGVRRTVADGARRRRRRPAG